MRKLDHYGIRRSTYSWIWAFSNDRTQQVFVEGAASESIPVISTVPQGTVMGSLLFLLFINNLPDCMKSSIRFFADDCILYRHIKNQQDCAILQEDLNKPAAWERQMVHGFPPRQVQYDQDLKIRKPNLQKSCPRNRRLYQAPGVVQSNLSWDRHIYQSVKKANSMLRFLRRNLKVSIEYSKTSAYHSVIRPLLDYCSTVWSPHTREYIQKIEMVQARAAPYVINRYHSTSSMTTMLDCLELETLEARRTDSSCSSKSSTDIPDEKYLTPASSLTSSSPSLKFRQIPASSDYHKYSFFPNIVFFWNSLPASVANAPCLASFKRDLSKVPF